MIGQTVSHYRILSPIGEGGMGVVYVAEDLRLGRRVAVKFPLAGNDEQNYRARFHREARAVSALNHPNIAAVYDFGETEDGRPYLVMELVEGESLSDLLARGMTLARVVEIVQDVAAALAEAHRRGVIHRDVKPSNVHLNARGEVKVLDFGLAKQLDETALAAAADGQTAFSVRTRSDVVIGTPLYLSPEQARGKDVDARSDLFALGALLYECAAGRPPFSGANVIEIGAQVLHVDPPPPSRHNPRVPAELDRVCLKALAKEPGGRYQTAQEMIDALEPVRLRLAGNDSARTRRLATQGGAAVRRSALNTIQQTLSRPRFSPLAVAAVVVAALVGVWAYAYLRRPAPHEPPPEVARLYAEGVQALRDGAYHRASVVLGDAVRLDDGYALAHARLAEAWAELDFLDRARDEMLRATSLVPDRSVLTEEEGLHFDAVRASVARRHDEAVTYYQKLAGLRPQSRDAQLDLGRAYEKNEQPDQAAAAYAEATRLDPKYATAFLRLGAVYTRLNNGGPATAAFEQAERLYTEPLNQEGRAEVFYQRALLLINTSGRLADARRELTRSIEIAREAGNRSQHAQALIQLSVVSSKENNHDAAVSDAAAAVETAQTAAMPNLTARGLDALGTAYIYKGDYTEAENNYKRAIEVSRLNRLRRYEARALFNLGALRLRQGRLDECIDHVDQAREFYEQNGYRKEMVAAAMLLGRVRRQRGDFAGAHQTFEELRALAAQSGDMQQLAESLRELGTVQLLWGRYGEAVENLRQCHIIFKTLGNQTNVAYALVKQSDALWRLGRYDDSATALAEASAHAGPREGGNRDLFTYITLIEAYTALSQRRFADAAATARQALSLGSQNKELVNEATRVAGEATFRAGGRAEGLRLCEEALARSSATTGGEPRLTALAHLSLASVRGESGDHSGALDAARRAQEFFAQAGQPDAEWEARAVAARAAAGAGDRAAAGEHAARAADLVTQLRQLWGDASTDAFLARPDVAQLNKEVATLPIELER